MQEKDVTAAPSANLIAHWRFSEGSLYSVLDSSGNGYHGTAVNTNWSSAADVASLDPYAIYFNGSSSYIDTADFDINDDFTITAWIKVDPEEENGSVVGKHTSEGGNLVLFGIWNNRYHFRIRDKTFDGPYVHRGEWIHIAVTAFKEVAGPTSIERVSLYINGAFIDQYGLITEVGDVSGGKPWTIGQDWDGQTRTDFFDGAIDDVRIYDGELLPSEIKDLSEDYVPRCNIFPNDVPDLNFAAGSGVCDEVILENGTYNAANIEPQNDVTIKGNGIGSTIVQITGSGSKRFLNNTNWMATLEDMTVQGGNVTGADGSGGGLNNNGTMVLNRVRLTNNYSEGDGGAIYNSGQMTLNDVQIDGNNGDNGGGILNDLSGHAIVNTAHIFDNQSNGGGGILNTGDLTATNSLIEDNTSANSGGGILNYGILMMSDTEVYNNTAFGQGGGIYNDDFSSFIGTATIIRSQITTNAANQDGGGIANRGTLSLDQSTVDGNSAQNRGGGISNSQLAIQIQITNSTISYNRAGGVGAGLDNEVDAFVTNSTFSGNQRTESGDGAGIYSTGNLVLRHVTITNNSSAASGTTNGLYVFGTLSIYNSIITDNGSASPNCNLSGTSVIQAGNLSNDNSCVGLPVDENTHLLPLSDNGGYTWTHALPANSPAFEAADGTYCTLYDQRGVPRGPVCDVGAFELGEGAIVFLPTVVR